MDQGGLASVETIVAQATPPGRGGVGIVRVSGPLCQKIAQKMLGCIPSPRIAEYLTFRDNTQEIIDFGIAIYFPGPNSFTGEDVIELQGHGGPVVIERLIRCITGLGARIAKPGEFSERAFLNDKIDLTQAEAIADLIDSVSEQAARCAIRSLAGDFSAKIHGIVEQLTHLRLYVEAAIDFPEEEIDFLADEKITNQINELIQALDCVLSEAKQGALLREGTKLVIAGKPNAGKSSLLNALSGRESAIVTAIPGTTRDLLREYILIDGIPLHIIDTAGLRQSECQVEQEGIRRAQQEIANADLVLLVVDSSETTETNPDILWPEWRDYGLSAKQITVVRNKIDLTNQPVNKIQQHEVAVLSLSAKLADGIDNLRAHLKQRIGATATTEGGFIARQRHLDALNKARQYLITGHEQLNDRRAGELLAEDLRFAQYELGSITGEVTADDLLGKIFSSFCIGK